MEESKKFLQTLSLELLATEKYQVFFSNDFADLLTQSCRMYTFLSRGLMILVKENLKYLILSPECLTIITT